MLEALMSTSWEKILKDEISKDYFQNIIEFINQEKEKGKIIYPESTDIFNAFKYAHFDTVKVVLIGQDPYHNPLQANGFCFSVNEGIKVPPSLVNIYKEIKDDIGVPIPTTGNLINWAKQGVLMLNATLTVEAHKPNAHRDIGWDTFTNEVIKKISDEKENVVFILWGKFAQGKEKWIDASKHLILKAAHPSPFSAYNGFFGCKHFSKTNDFLKANKMQTINWNVHSN